MNDSVDVDARGMKCPWPALRLARAMRERECNVIVADDPAAPGEISALADERNWRCEPVPTAVGEGYRVSRGNQRKFDIR